VPAPISNPAKDPKKISIKLMSKKCAQEQLLSKNAQ